MDNHPQDFALRVEVSEGSDESAGKAPEVPTQLLPSESRGLRAEVLDELSDHLSCRVVEGRYEILGEHARGGLGRILRARDRELERPVAIKELLEPGEQAEARFAREALVTARLQHPAIVPVYEMGRWPSGKLFYAMKMVSGRSFSQLIKETRSFQERLALLPNVIAVSDAIACAHSQRVIHRDLKPANVLIGPFGETMVVDWGLATDLERTNPSCPSTPGPYDIAATPLTVAGSVMGTPQYMPPEQAEGKEVDERADVYAIGAILYHLFAGVPPFEGRSSKEILAQVKSRAPVPLEQREPRMPAQLAAIIRKAMAPDRLQRYETAAELAQDLKRFQTGQLVTAHAYLTPDTAPELSVRVLSSLILYFEQLHGRTRLESLWEQKKLGLSLQYLKTVSNFVSFQYAQRLLDVLISESGDSNFARKAAMLTATREAIGFPYYYFKALRSLRSIFKTVIEVSSTYNRVGCIALERLARNSAVITYRSKVTEPNRNFCEFRMNQFASMPMIWGLPPALAQESTCQLNGDECCRYHLRWYNPNRAWRRYVGLLVGIGTAVYLAWSGLAPLGVALPSFGLVGLLLGAWLDSRAELRDKDRYATEAGLELLSEFQHRYEKVYSSEVQRESGKSSQRT